LTTEKNRTHTPVNSDPTPQRSDSQALIICDICDTLYTVNTTTDFLRHVSADLGIPHRLFTTLITNRRSPLPYALAIAGRALKVDLGRNLLLHLLKGIPRDRLKNLADSWVKNELPQYAQPKTHHLLQKSRSEGHKIILASASIDVIVEAIAQSLDVEFVSSVLETNASGILTGRLSLDAKGKKEHLLADVIEEAEHLTVITDNESDLKLLRRADRRVIILRKGDVSLRYWRQHLDSSSFETL